MKKKLVFAFLVVGLALASAKTYSLTLFKPSVLGGTELKAGDYKLELKDQKVIIRSGKQATEANVKVETSSDKYSSTSVRYTNGDGKTTIREIRLGGTNMKLVLDN